MIKKSLTLIAAISIAGCTSTYQFSKMQTPTAKLDPTQDVLISIPEDGWYGNQQYVNSGQMTVNALRSAFTQYSGNADLAEGCLGEECLESIDIEKYGYFVEPIILHWEERATEWSGKPDRIEIQIIVYDAVTREELANSSYTGKSKWATFGGDHPQDLLPEPTNEYVSGLYK